MLLGCVVSYMRIFSRKWFRLSNLILILSNKTLKLSNMWFDLAHIPGVLSNISLDCLKKRSFLSCLARVLNRMKLKPWSYVHIVTKVIKGKGELDAQNNTCFNFYPRADGVRVG